MDISKERLEDRPINYVSVLIGTELDCNPAEGEYSLYVASFIGVLDIHSFGGVDDISLIKECIENNLDQMHLPAEGQAEVVLRESGEWEDVFWHKYYEIERVNIA